MKLNDLLTTAQVAAMYGLAPVTIYKRAKRRGIKPTIMAGRWLFTPAQVEALAPSPNASVRKVQR